MSSYYRLRDNIYGQQRYCLQPGCRKPSLETAPWGMGFCEDCMPAAQERLNDIYQPGRATPRASIAAGTRQPITSGRKAA